MPTVHIFVSRDRFDNEEEIKNYIDPVYTEDGDMEDSQFMHEVSLEEYEPMCIEAVYDHLQKVSSLLQNNSYSEQWLGLLGSDLDLIMDSAICLYSPNLPQHPEASSLRYLGAFEYVHK